jgi:hypothetical protein
MTSIIVEHEYLTENKMSLELEFHNDKTVVLSFQLSDLSYFDETLYEPKDNIVMQKGGKKTKKEINNVINKDVIFLKMFGFLHEIFRTIEKNKKLPNVEFCEYVADIVYRILLTYSG